MANHPNRAATWQTDSGSVMLRYMDEDGERVREFWVPASGGYVREVDARNWGTQGRQVCKGLTYMGEALWSTRDGLLALIRRERQRARHEANIWRTF